MKNMGNIKEETIKEIIKEKIETPENLSCTDAPGASKSVLKTYMVVLY